MTHYLIKSKCKTPINITINGEIFIVPAKPNSRSLYLEENKFPEDLQKLIDNNIVKISRIN